MKTIGRGIGGHGRSEFAYRIRFTLNQRAGMAPSAWFKATATLTYLIVAPFLASSLAQDAPRGDTADIEKQVTAIVADWESLPGIFDDIEIYSGQIKKLVEIGPSAVPALTAALGQTSRDAPLRLIPFTLRAIGDARAVPALIRALPKTLRPPGSDCSMTVPDHELLRFMQAHDIEGTEGRGGARRDFGMGRPVREVAAALRKITGTNLNEAEVFSTFITGGEQQRALQRKAFHDVTESWAGWWKTNWKQFVTDPSLADVQLPALKEEVEEVSLSRFLTGPNIKTSGGMSGVVLSPIEGGRNCALHLGLNRRVELPQMLSESGSNSFQNVSAWAARAGVDLLGTQYRDPESGKLYYCLRGVGLQAWEIGNEQWDQIEGALQRDTFPPLDAPATDFLMHYDAAAGRYLPEKKATFVFITREGLQGILRITAQVTQPINPGMIRSPFLIRPDESGPDQRIASGFKKGAQFDYKFFYAETEEMKSEEIARRDAAAAREESRYQRKMAKLFAAHPPLSGTIYLPGGTVASGAAVLLGIPGEGAVLGDRRFEYPRRSTMVHTPADGKFVLPHVPAAHHIYVAHEDGFAEVNLADTKSPLSIHLAPWGRIEGAVVRQGKPAPREKLAILNSIQGADEGLSLAPGVFKTESDSEGRFIFSNLPPGEIQVCRMVNNTHYEAQVVQVAAGKTTVFQHGFNGRTLTGRLVTSDSSPAEWNSGRPFPFRFHSKAQASVPPGGEARKHQPTTAFPVVVAPNGEFHIENVPAGVYEFRGELHEGAADDIWALGKVLGRFNREITVPERQADQDDALALGEIVVQMVTILKPGDPAPDFEIKTTDGGALRLADFRGKYVLLDFWATWCGPCRAEMPNLKELFNSFGAHPKFAMIGLSLDRNVDAPANYAKKEGLGWRQGFLGELSTTTLPARYGVEGIPATFLIDPEGKIINTGLRGAEMKAAVSAALADR